MNRDAIRRAAAVAAMLLMAGAPAAARAEGFTGVPANPATVEGFESRAARADALAAEHRWEEAREITGPLARDHPEDPSAQMRDAWVLFSMGRWTQARNAYERARVLAPDNPDALLGLGWTAQRMGDLSAARDRFNEVLRILPGNASALQGLAVVGRSWSVTPAVFGVGEYYAGHPSRRWQAGAVALLDATIATHFRLGALYRFLHVGGRPIPGTGGARSTTDNHEAWLSLGWQEARWGLALHGAFAHYTASGAAAGTTWSPDSGMIGISGRLTWWADFVVSLTRSFYDDFGVTQATGGIWLPVLPWLAIHGGVEVQMADGAVYPSGIVVLRFHQDTWRLDLTGRYGDRRRPVDLGESSLYNLPDDRLTYGAGIRAAFPLGGRAKGFAAYDLEGIRTPAQAGTNAAATASTGHRLTLGASVAF